MENWLPDDVTNESVVKGKKTHNKKTLYWGIDVQIHQFLENTDVVKYVNDNNMKLKDEFHVTLLFFQKGNQHKGDKYLELEGKKCKLDVSSFGRNSNAIAIKVDSMEYLNNDQYCVMPSDQESINHITVALGGGTKPKNSVQVFNDTNNIVKLENPVTLYGTIKQYTA